jgi:hypothetical protein
VEEVVGELGAVAHAPDLVRHAPLAQRADRHRAILVVVVGQQDDHAGQQAVGHAALLWLSRWGSM